jgi:hypothetical protein
VSKVQRSNNYPVGGAGRAGGAADKKVGCDGHGSGVSEDTGTGTVGREVSKLPGF